MKLNEHNAEWHRWTLMGALRFNPKIGKLIDLDTIEEAIGDLIAQVKAEEREWNARLVESWHINKGGYTALARTIRKGDSE